MTKCSRLVKPVVPPPKAFPFPQQLHPQLSLAHFGSALRAEIRRGGTRGRRRRRSAPVDKLGRALCHRSGLARMLMCYTATPTKREENKYTGLRQRTHPLMNIIINVHDQSLCYCNLVRDMCFNLFCLSMYGSTLLVSVSNLCLALSFSEPSAVSLDVNYCRCITSLSFPFKVDYMEQERTMIQ